MVFLFPMVICFRRFYWDVHLNDGLTGWIDASPLESALDFVTEGRAITTVDFTGTFVLMVVDSDN